MHHVFATWLISCALGPIAYMPYVIPTISHEENLLYLDWIKAQRIGLYSGVLDFYTSKLRSTSKMFIGRYSFTDTWSTGYPMTSKEL